MHIFWVAAGLSLAAAWAAAAEPGSAAEPYDSGWSLYLDNDIFSLAGQDRDYTGGLAINLAGARAAQWPLSLDPALGWLDRQRERRWGADATPPLTTLHSLQFGLAAFAPDELESRQPVLGDRPYASLIYLSNSRVSLQPGSNTAIQTTLTLGLLGSPLAGDFQEAFHSAIGSTEPQGWDRQISAGGELTARYSYARQQLWRGGNQGRTRHELKRSWEVSVGYITEANASLSWRWGRINTPWWSFTPDRAEYFAQPTPGLAPDCVQGPREFYVWAGIKGRARTYNALLQGQFRDSVLSYDWDEVRPVLGEAWLGVTGQVGEHYRLSWVLRYQSAELRDEIGDRELLWGSVFISRYF